MDELELIAAISERVADPERRLDVRPSVSFASVKGLSLGGLHSAGRAARVRAVNPMQN